MRRGLRWLPLLLLLLPVLLTACMSTVRIKADASLLRAQRAREHKLAHADHWQLQGRLGVSDGKHGGSGSFSWIQNGEQYTFVLRAPITGKSFRLRGGPDGAELDGLDQGPLQGRDAETLMRQALGWEVPLRDLRAWVLGVRAPHVPAQLSFGENHLPSLLHQDGWSVDYRQWDDTRQPPLPTRVYASKPPYKVRLSIDSWQLQ